MALEDLIASSLTLSILAEKKQAEANGTQAAATLLVEDSIRGWDMVYDELRALIENHPDLIGFTESKLYRMLEREMSRDKSDAGSS